MRTGFEGKIVIAVHQSVELLVTLQRIKVEGRWKEAKCRFCSQCSQTFQQTLLGREEFGTVFWGMAQRTGGFLGQFLFHKMEIEGEKQVGRPCLISRHCYCCPLRHHRIAQGFLWQHLDVMKCLFPQWSQKAPGINVPHSGYSHLAMSSVFTTGTAWMLSWGVSSHVLGSVCDGCWGVPAADL